MFFIEKAFRKTNLKKLLLKYALLAYSDISCVTTSPGLLFKLYASSLRGSMLLTSFALSCWHILLYQLLFISTISLCVCVRESCNVVAYVCVCGEPLLTSLSVCVCVCDLSLLGDLSDGLLSRVS